MFFYFFFGSTDDPVGWCRLDLQAMRAHSLDRWLEEGMASSVLVGGFNKHWRYPPNKQLQFQVDIFQMYFGGFVGWFVERYIYILYRQISKVFVESGISIWIHTRYMQTYFFKSNHSFFLSKKYLLPCVFPDNFLGLGSLFLLFSNFITPFSAEPTSFYTKLLSDVCGRIFHILNP